MAADDSTIAADQRIAHWVAEHAVAVRGYLLGMVRRSDVADDLLQEVFRRAWQARDRYRDRGCERAYLLKIADRLAIDRSRRFGLEVTVDDATWQEVEPAANSSGPVEELVASEASHALAAALDQLTANQRRVLLLRYYSDMTFEDIAAATECPLGTVLSHCRRGLIALKKLLTTAES